MSSRHNYFLRLRCQKKEQAEQALRKKIERFLQHETDPESLAGEQIEIPAEHPSGFGGERLYIPEDWWNYLPEGHPALVRAGWTGDEVSAGAPDLTLLAEKMEEEQRRKKLAAFLLHVTNPNLVRETTVEIYPGHPSGLGGTSLYIPRYWWEYLPDDHPALVALMGGEPRPLEPQVNAVEQWIYQGTSTSLEERVKAYRAWKEEQGEKKYRQKMAAFLRYVTDPDLLAGKKISIYPGHPSGLGGQDIYIEREWWEFIPEEHPALSRFTCPSSVPEEDAPDHQFA